MKKVIMVMMLSTLGIAFMGLSTALAGWDCCGSVGTGSPGYWKNHPGAWPSYVEEICLTRELSPDICFDKEEVLDLMSGPVRRNKWLTLFRAYVAAILNVEIGNCRPSCVTDWGPVNLDTVESWLYFNESRQPVYGRDPEWQYSHGEAQYWCLDDYNNGLLPGIPSRDALE